MHFLARARLRMLLVPLLTVWAVTACEDDTGGAGGAVPGLAPGLDGATSPGNDGGAAPTDAGDLPTTPQPGDLFVNAQSGNDDSSGLDGQPFRTITKALSVATAPRSVWLEDGAWDAAVEPALGGTGSCGDNQAGLVVKAGVAVRGLHPGAATVKLSGSVAFCLEGNALSGFKLERTSGPGYLLVIGGAPSTLAGISLSGVMAGDAPAQGGFPLVSITGGASVTMTPGGLASYTTSVGKVVVVDSNASLVVNGGAFDDSYAGGDFTLATASGGKILLNGAAVRRRTGPAPATPSGIGVCGTCAVELRGGSVVEGFADAHGVFLERGGKLAVIDSMVQKNRYGVFATNGTSGGGPVSELTLSGNSQVRENVLDGVRGDFAGGHSLAVSVAGTAAITKNGAHGVNIATGALTMTGGSLTENASSGANLGSLVAVSLRNATVTQNGLSGIALGSTSVANASPADLGTKASPGGNTFRQNYRAAGADATSSNVFLAANAPASVSAIGNTWDPSNQGSDSNGAFTGSVVLTGPITAGTNMRVYGSGSMLHLSEP